LLAPTLPWISSTAHIPSLFQSGTIENRYFHTMVPDGSVAVVLPAVNPGPGQGYAVLWQAADGMAFKTPTGDLPRPDANGVAVLGPPPSPLWTAMSALQTGRSPSFSPPELDSVRAELISLGARAVVVGPMSRQDLAVAYFVELFGRTPINIGGAWVWPLV
jgi:hypothetical protein